MTINGNPEDTDPAAELVDMIVARRESEPAWTFGALQRLAPRSVNATLQLGWAHEHGLGTSVDMAAAEECYRSAAEAGSPTGLFNLGVCNQNRQDYPQALEFYSRAAARGHARARNAQINLQVYTAYHGLKTDPTRAHETLRSLAEQGSVQSMVYLAWTYETGCGTTADPRQAERWYQRAFNEGTGDPKADAAYYLGLICQERGEYAKAREYFQYGCDEGEAKALYRMAKLYGRGLGVAKDRHRARSLYERAARLGSLFALRDLAWQDLSGRFGLRNFFHGIPRLLRTLRGFSARLETWENVMVITPKKEDGS